MSVLLAQLAGRSLVDILIIVVIVAAVIAIVFVALRHFGISIPPAVVQIVWIVIVAVLAILGIRFILTL